MMAPLISLFIVVFCVFCSEFGPELVKGIMAAREEIESLRSWWTRPSTSFFSRVCNMLDDLLLLCATTHLIFFGIAAVDLLLLRGYSEMVGLYETRFAVEKTFGTFASCSSFKFAVAVLLMLVTFVYILCLGPVRLLFVAGNDLLDFVAFKGAFTVDLVDFDFITVVEFFQLFSGSCFYEDFREAKFQHSAPSCF